MKNSIQRITIAVVSVSFGFIGGIIAFREWSVAKEIMPSLTTLLAAFLGAWFAFSLQNKSKEKEENNKKISEGNKALFTLCQRVNNLWLIQKNIIDPYRNHPGIHIAMPPTQDFETGETHLDIEGLKFLLDTDFQQLLLDLHIEDQRYKTAIMAVNTRSQLHFSQIQPRLEKRGITEGQFYSQQYWEGAIGHRLYLTLQRATQDLVENVDKTIESTVNVKDNLVETLKKVFPEEKFFNFEIAEKTTEQGA